MGLLTRESVNELKTAHDRVAGGLDNLERFLQTVRLTYIHLTDRGPAFAPYA